MQSLALIGRHQASCTLVQQVVEEPFDASPLPDELDEFSAANSHYRHVMYTDLANDVDVGTQQVAMSVGYGQQNAVGWEKHAVTQYFAVVAGEGEMFIGRNSDKEQARRQKIQKGSKWMVPAGAWHDVVGDLKLYTLYTHQQHPPGQIDRTREDAERRERETELRQRADERQRTVIAGPGFFFTTTAAHEKTSYKGERWTVPERELRILEQRLAVALRQLRAKKGAESSEAKLKVKK